MPRTPTGQIQRSSLDMPSRAWALRLNFLLLRNRTSAAETLSRDHTELDLTYSEASGQSAFFPIGTMGLRGTGSRLSNVDVPSVKE
jgi:hypothetical protein